MLPQSSCPRTRELPRHPIPDALIEVIHNHNNAAAAVSNHVHSSLLHSASANWASVDEAPDLQVLKLNHLFFDDEANEFQFRYASGKEKHMNWIFLRPDARDVWDHIYSRLLDKPETREGGGMPPGPQAFLTVTGNSGIGKSYSIIYVLKKFLSENRVVFYDFRK